MSIPEPGSIWHKANQPKPYQRYRVTWVEGWKVLLRRCDIAGRVQKGARPMYRTRQCFDGPTPMYLPEQNVLR